MFHGRVRVIVFVTNRELAERGVRPGPCPSERGTAVSAGPEQANPRARLLGFGLETLSVVSP